MEPELLDRAQRFASELAETVSVFTGEQQSFVAQLRGSRVSIGEANARGIPLKVGGRTHLTLVIEFHCEWDTSGRYLAIESSSFGVIAGTKVTAEPLFRYDYVRKPLGGFASSHLQVHAHRDAFTHALSSAGRGSARGKRLEKLKPGDPPELRKFHFPLGGPRFRPCLEDLLEALKDEFGLDAGPQWRRALSEGRLRWRALQLQAAVRDAPEIAADTLRDLGYSVSTGHVPRQSDQRRAQL